MYHDEEVELTAEERNALASLPRAITPSPMLEAHVVRALRSDGHFGFAARGIGGVSLAFRIAAAIALFAGGVATGRYALSVAPAQRTASTSPGVTRVPSSATSSTAVPRDASPAGSAAKSVSRRGETVVAEREMWL